MQFIPDFPLLFNRDATSINLSTFRLSGRSPYGNSVYRGLPGPHIVAEYVFHVDEPCMSALGDLLDGFEVCVRELGDLRVALDARGRRALGQHDVAATQPPREQDLRQRVPAAVRDLVERLVRAHLLARRGDLILGSEGRVGLDDDVVGLAELDQLLVRQERMHLDLVDLGLDFGEAQQLLEARYRPSSRRRWSEPCRWRGALPSPAMWAPGSP